MNRGEEWSKIRIKVLMRDSHTCRKCGTKESLNVHHIIPFSKSHRNNITELITLCPNCHATSENEFRRNGITNFTKNRMIENVRMTKPCT